MCVFECVCGGRRGCTVYCVVCVWASAQLCVHLCVCLRVFEYASLSLRTFFWVFLARAGLHVCSLLTAKFLFGVCSAGGNEDVQIELTELAAASLWYLFFCRPPHSHRFSRPLSRHLNPPCVIRHRPPISSATEVLDVYRAKWRKTYFLIKTDHCFRQLQRFVLKWVEGKIVTDKMLIQIYISLCTIRSNRETGGFKTTTTTTTKHFG